MTASLLTRIEGGTGADAPADLREHWADFCDSDFFDGIDTFPERMEAAGLIKCVPVTRAALQEAFAAERGIEPGGMMWVLTGAGKRALQEQSK